MNNYKGTVCITYCDLNDGNEVQIVYEEKPDREIEIVLEYPRRTSNCETNDGTHEDVFDGQENIEEDETSLMEWLPEPRDEFENTCSYDYINKYNSELGNFDDALQKIYDEYNRDLDQSCFNYDNEDSLDLTMENSKGKPIIKNSATCTGSMWRGVSPCDGCDAKLLNHWYSLLLRGKERTEEELDRLALAQEEWS